MSSFQCPRCGQQRARHRDTLCPVCWLLEDFLAEHADGLHKHKAVHGCGECNDRLRAELARINREHAPRVLTDDVKLSAPPARAQRVQSTSHATCAHEATKSARAKCRAMRRG